MKGQTREMSKLNQTTSGWRKNVQMFKLQLCIGSDYIQQERKHRSSKQNELRVFHREDRGVLSDTRKPPTETENEKGADLPWPIIMGPATVFRI